jgi:hypothetical protein
VSNTRWMKTFAAALVFALLAALTVGASRAFAQNEGTLGGIVYYDKNANGIREEGEEGIQDAEVKFDSGGWNTTINTPTNGAFSIALNPATWTVSVKAPAGYTAPKSSTEVVIKNPGDAVTNIEFGLVKEGEVLPAGGAPVSATTLIAGLFAVMAVGLALVAFGQYRSRHAA